jgi:cytochrome c
MNMVNPLAWAAAVALCAVCADAAHAQDAAVGEHDFANCAACHPKDSTNSLGPGLSGIVGRHAGAVPGFHYSNAMKSSGIVWDATSLDSFLASPQKAVPGNVMPFSGIPDPKERADIIAYLETLK